MSSPHLTATLPGSATPAEAALIALTLHADRIRTIRAHGDAEFTRTAEALCRVLGRRAVRSGADALTVALVLDYAEVEEPIPFTLSDEDTPVRYEVAA
ncbi:hypothetical protein [Corynebacterium variabile]|uniref:hypothetical protein n=1 Tax=Corynebacterium variabile TaxID=1727 RepID=UPI00264A0B9E|nr:hypothetical protein [Corynebacterium variabile]MDN6660941.1 hypothetical protein [Corynebacterium variabile]MDN6675766.1 hypothetical protein [Corynebacterium variabile]